ncbi:MAG TPA: ABC transporter permease [Atribacterota bacterium]|nr:ABC transporter permease [Atribacterota bacterium]
MNLLWNLAKKNLFRSRARTIVSVIAIAIAVMAVVFLRGMINGMLESTFKNHIYYKAGHIRVINREYQLKEHLLSLNYPVDGFKGEGYGQMVEKLKELEGVQQVIPRLKFWAMVTSGEKLINMTGWGVNPEEEIKFTGINRLITEGRMVKSGEREIVMGAGLLDKTGFQVGDRITFLYNTAFDSLKASTFLIVGKIESGLELLNKGLFYIPLEQAQKILEIDDEVTELLIITSDYKRAGSLLPSIQELFAQESTSGKYLIQLWNRDYDLVEIFVMAKTIYNFIYIFIIILACFVLINTLIMIVNERTREIGMMGALGLKPREILLLFAMEGIIIGVWGSAIGAIVGGVMTKIFSIVGIDFSAALEGVSADLLFESVFYTVFSLENLVFAFILGVVVVTVACMIPARMAARLEPQEALR